MNKIFNRQIITKKLKPVQKPVRSGIIFKAEKLPSDKHTFGQHPDVIQTKTGTAEILHPTLTSGLERG